MCIPQAAVLPLMIATTAASGAVSVLGNAQAAASQSAALKYQASVNEANAKQERNRVVDATNRGQENLEDHARKVAQLRGRQIAMLSARGLDVSFGSPSDIITDTSVLGLEDAGRIAENARREAQGYEVSAYNYTASAGGDRLAARNVKRALPYQQLSTILGTASKIGGLYSGSKYGG